jgi:hypothetical protein
MGAGFLAALAAMGAAAIAPERAGDRPAAAEVSQTSQPANVARALVALAATAAAVAIADDGDAAIEITPIRISPFAKGRQAAFDSHIELGVGLSLAAYRLKERDPLAREGFRNDAQAMGKSIPGYPQSPKIVVGLKIAF